MKKLNSKGFGLLGILSVIIVLALAGVIGVYVYHKNHKTKTTASSSSSTGTKTGSTGGSTAIQGSGSTGNQQAYLVINEWGVRIKPATSLPSVTYSIDNSDGHQWAVLTFKDLPDTCVGVYHFSRALAGQDIDGYGNSPEKLLSIDPSSVKKVGDYYYYLGHDQADCAPASAVTEETSLVQQLSGRTTSSDTDKYTVEADI